MGTYYRKGSWNAICDVCGKQIKSHEGRFRWDNLFVCHEDFETRHPMDLFKPDLTESTIPWTRPPSEDKFVDLPPPPIIAPPGPGDGLPPPVYNQSAVVNLAIVDWAVVDSS